MDYKVNVFQRTYPVLTDFIYHYIIYKEMMCELENTVSVAAIWNRTCDAHIKVAASSWCMIFGEATSNPTHWKNINFGGKENAEDLFINRLLLDLELTKSELRKNVKEVLDFRNKFVVHREIKFNEPTPNFKVAYDIALTFDKWAREMIYPDRFDGPEFEELIEAARSTIRKNINDLITGLQ